jgi:lipopolysaccharide assembly protein A
MQFLRTLFWVMIAAAIAIFAYVNWTPVTINLWSGLVLDTRLPVPVIVAFLLGLLPMMILHRATRWSLNRKLTTVQRNLTELRPVAPPPTAQAPYETSGTLPPVAAPIAVPPGVL